MDKKLLKKKPMHINESALYTLYYDKRYAEIIDSFTESGIDLTDAFIRIAQDDAASYAVRKIQAIKTTIEKSK